MHARTDGQLLRDYVERGEESAFAEIVERYTNLVYSAALRQIESPDMAAEVTQNVFIGLAHGAKVLCAKLSQDASLAGWLCRSARNVSLNLVRNEIRRHSRERLAMEEPETAPESTVEWDRIRPVLDEAMEQLSEPDYDAIVLRFFKQQDMVAIGRALGVSDDAAQKRISRALEKLRELLSRRGITTTTATLATACAANAVQAAPIGLAAAITSAVAGSGTLATAASLTATNAVIMTTLQKTVIAIAVVAVGVGTPLTLQHRAQSRLIAENESLRKQAAQVGQLASENQRLSNLAARTTRPRTASDAPSLELLRLRGEVGLLRNQNQEIAKLLQSRQQTQQEFEPSASWADSGNSTPEAAAGTFAWAIKSGNQSRLADVLALENDPGNTNATPSATDIFQVLQPLISEIDSSRVIATDTSVPDEVTYWFQNRFKDGNSLVSPLTVKRVGNAWKVKMIVGPTKTGVQMGE